uniref:Uncharacterized protein n=1 Tax=Anopheles dirus TaxID=7168 RepID=A0A182NXP3_9DIPT
PGAVRWPGCIVLTPVPSRQSEYSFTAVHSWFPPFQEGLRLDGKVSCSAQRMLSPNVPNLVHNRADRPPVFPGGIIQQQAVDVKGTPRVNEIRDFFSRARQEVQGSVSEVCH